MSFDSAELNSSLENLLTQYLDGYDGKRNLNVIYIKFETDFVQNKIEIAMVVSSKFTAVYDSIHNKLTSEVGEFCPFNESLKTREKNDRQMMIRDSPENMKGICDALFDFFRNKDLTRPVHFLMFIPPDINQILPDDIQECLLLSTELMSKHVVMKGFESPIRTNQELVLELADRKFGTTIYYTASTKLLDMISRYKPSRHTQQLTSARLFIHVHSPNYQDLKQLFHYIIQTERDYHFPYLEYGGRSRKHLSELGLGRLFMLIHFGLHRDDSSIFHAFLTQELYDPRLLCLIEEFLRLI